MIPTRRDLRFGLTVSHANLWHAHGAVLTHFINAMSLTFPEGERYFIHTVRAFREAIETPELRAAVTAFIGQEAIHGREHEAYNRLLEEVGLPAERLQKEMRVLFELLKRHLSPATQLSITIAQEHFTAVIAELLLSEPELIEGADPRLAALWRWHALEEIEHKAVAFDVYEAAVGRGPGAYALRCGAMVATTAGFLAMVLWCQAALLKADDRPGGRAGAGRFLRFMTAAPGLVPKLAKPWLAYFDPRFHPWQHDNSALLEHMRGVLLDIAQDAPAKVPAPSPVRAGKTRRRAAPGLAA